jgi:hypothetical protein
MLNADYMCRTYVPGPVVDPITTTVAAFRELRIGPGIQHPHAFSKYPETAAAAWCWTGKPGAQRVRSRAGCAAAKVARNMSRPFHDENGAPVLP